MFSQEAGMTVPQYLRKIRMERAGKLLLTGKFNVSEAAIEVGYNSLSHFQQAVLLNAGNMPSVVCEDEIARAIRPGRTALRRLSIKQAELPRYRFDRA